MPPFPPSAVRRLPREPQGPLRPTADLWRQPPRRTHA